MLMTNVWKKRIVNNVKLSEQKKKNKLVVEHNTVATFKNLRSRVAATAIKKHWRSEANDVLIKVTQYITV